MMKGRIAIFGVFALLCGLAVVLWFSPRAGSFWGQTFFGLPYSFARGFVSLASGVLGAASACAVLGNDEYSRRHLRLGVAIGAMSFLGYGVAHTIALMVVGPISLAVSFFVAFIMFGGLVFLPVSVVLAALASVLGYSLFCPDKPLGPTR